MRLSKAAEIALITIVGVGLLSGIGSCATAKPSGAIIPGPTARAASTGGSAAATANSAPYEGLQYQVGSYIIAQSAWNGIPAQTKASASSLLQALSAIPSRWISGPYATSGQGAPVTVSYDITGPGGPNLAPPGEPARYNTVDFRQIVTASGMVNLDNSISLQLNIKDTESALQATVIPAPPNTPAPVLTQPELTTTPTVQSGQTTVIVGYGPGAGSASSSGSVFLTVLTVSITNSATSILTPTTH